MNFIVFMSGAIFGLVVGGLFSNAHEDPFTMVSEDQKLTDLIRRDAKNRPYITTYDSDYQYICPECLHAFEKNERPDYCPDCGQHINWEGCDD